MRGRYQCTDAGSNTIPVLKMKGIEKEKSQILNVLLAYTVIIMMLVLSQVQVGDSRTSQVVYELLKKLGNIQNNEIVSLLY